VRWPERRYNPRRLPAVWHVSGPAIKPHLTSWSSRFYKDGDWGQGKIVLQIAGLFSCESCLETTRAAEEIKFVDGWIDNA